MRGGEQSFAQLTAAAAGSKFALKIYFKFSSQFWPFPQSQTLHWKLLSAFSFTTIIRLGEGRIVWQKKILFPWHTFIHIISPVFHLEAFAPYYDEILRMYHMFLLFDSMFHKFKICYCVCKKNMCLPEMFYFLTIESLNVWRSCSDLLYVKYCTIQYHINIYCVSLSAQYIKTVYSILTKLFDWCTHLLSFATLGANANC